MKYLNISLERNRFLNNEEFLRYCWHVTGVEFYELSNIAFNMLLGYWNKNEYSGEYLNLNSLAEKIRDDVLNNKDFQYYCWLVTDIKYESLSIRTIGMLMKSWFKGVHWMNFSRRIWN